jgi:hypothetical protein
MWGSSVTGVASGAAVNVGVGLLYVVGSTHGTFGASAAVSGVPACSCVHSHRYLHVLQILLGGFNSTHVPGSTQGALVLATQRPKALFVLIVYLQKGFLET